MLSLIDIPQYYILRKIFIQELESHFENTKHELQVTQEALAKFQSSQQVGFTCFNSNIERFEYPGDFLS